MTDALHKSNEDIAIRHLGAICRAYRENNLISLKAHTKVLRQLADTSQDATIRFAANEAEHIAKLKGITL